MLLVTIINELNHYVRRVACIGEDEGGKEMFKAIFGIEDFIIWNYHQALDIYHSDNWQKIIIVLRYIRKNQPHVFFDVWQ